MKNYQAVFLCLVVALISGCATQRVNQEDGEFVFYPPPPDDSRIQFLVHLRGEQDFTPKRSGLLRFLVGADRKKYRTMGKPYGIAGAGGKFYVTDTMGTSVIVLDFNSHTFGVFGDTGVGTLRKPTNVDLAPDGTLYVSDTIRRQVVAFTRSGNYITEYGSDIKAADVAVYGNTLYVLDIAAHDIKVFDRNTRELKRTIGKRGKEPGEFNYPTAIATDTNGYIYVCDALNFRIQKLDAEGNPITAFGEAGKAPGFLARPRGLDVAHDGIIYVADALLGVVQLFNQEGRVLTYFGGTGTDAGNMYLPAQVYLDYGSVDLFRDFIAPDFEPEYLIFVTNQLGLNSVSVYAFGRRLGAGDTPPQQ